MVSPAPVVSALSLPIRWEELGFPDPWQAGPLAIASGAVGWAWTPFAPDLPVAPCKVDRGADVSRWGVDHVVVLVPDLDDAIGSLGAIGLAPRLRMRARGRPAAFFRVGTVLEVIQSPVPGAALYGLALWTDEPLEVVALRWRSLGRDVSDPTPAIQPGRRIFRVRDVDAGLAVMSPDVHARGRQRDDGWPGAGKRR